MVSCAPLLRCPPADYRHALHRRPALEAVYESARAEVDIIAVHGLGSDVDWAWTWKEPTDPNNADLHVKWLQDSNMLPAVVPHSRILLYNYNSRWHTDAPKIRLSLCGEELIHSVRDYREGATTDRPIVFVGHSLGGNVIQHALLYANSDDALRHVVTSTVGIVFLGSPLRGSRFQSLAKIVAWFSHFAGSHDGIVRDLAYDDENLMDTLHHFCRMRNTYSLATFCFFELHETDYVKKMLGVGWPGRGRVVDEASACIPGLERISLAANHSEMNKYSGPDDRSFHTVSAALRRLCADAPAIVRGRMQHLLTEKPEAKECLPYLFLTDPYEDLQRMKRKKGDRVKGTCDWILGTDELTAWLGDAPESTSPPTDILWLYGNPGTGKSTMAMFLADALSEAFSKTPNKTLAYFFCDSGYDTRNTATALVRGLLLQLVQQHPRLIEYVLPKYEERKTRLFDSFDALWAIFLKACADTTTGRKYCVLDALDECTRSENETLLKQLKETFGRDRSSGGLNVSLLVTSRPYPEITQYLQAFPNRDLASFEESRRDIYRFIDAKVADLEDMKKYPPSVTEKVTMTLRDKAGGIFLWVGLACQELEKVGASKAVTHLKKIPRGLQSIYKQLLDAALQQDEEPETIERLLGFVMVARRPLSIRELASACCLFQDEGEAERLQFTTEVIASCRLMIVVQDEKVLLLHQSVREFLTGGTGGRKSFVRELEVHNRLAIRCVDCIIARFFRLEGSHGNAPDNDLDSYSIMFWPEHAHMAKEELKIEDSQAEFFAIDSRTRDRWWKAYAQERDWEPSRLSIFHVAARWGIPALVDHALSSMRSDAGPPGEAASYLYIDSAYRDSKGATPLEECARSDHIQVFKIMLERADPNSPITAAVSKAAAENEESGAEVMKVLLDRKGDQVTITDDIVQAAAGNWNNGAEVMKVLLDRKGDQVTITDEVVKAAAENLRSGAEVMKVLLDRKGDQVTIKDEVVKAAAGNLWSGAEVMKVLLDRRGDQVAITDDIVKAAAENGESGAELMKVLLDWKGDQMTITDTALAIVAGSFGAEVMKVLLDRKGDQVTITDDIVQAAAGNWNNGAEVMKVLLDRKGNQVTITDDIVQAAAGNLWSGAEVMKVLLDWKRDQVTITDDVVKAAAENRNSGAELMKVLLDRKGDQVTITDEVVKAAAGNWNSGAEVMKVLLDRKGDQVTITDDIVQAAAENLRSGAEVMKVLLDRNGDQVTIRDDIVQAAAENWNSGDEVMKVLLDRKGDQVTITDDVVKAAAGNLWSGAEVMKVLLDRKGDQATITDDIVKAAAGNLWSGAEVMKILLDRKGDQATITDDIVKAAAGNWNSGAELMKVLLDRKGDQVTITDEVVKAAAGNWNSGAEVMKVLLDRKRDQVTITDEVVKAAAGNWNSGAEVMKVLLDRKGDQVTITDDLVKAAAENEESGAELMKVLLDRKGDQVTITDEVVKAAAGNRNSGAEVMKVLLDRKGDQVTITDEVVKAAAGNRNSGVEVMKVLLDRKGDQVTITDDVVKALGEFQELR